MKSHNNIIISGGGTGGHIFPAISIAAEIKRRQPDADILFVGALGRMEMERVPDAGYPIVGLPVMGFDRRRPWRNVKVLWHLWKSMRLTSRIVRDFNPDIAIGVGGYASGPVLKRAQKLGIPTLIQEQNSYAGVTNKMLASRANAICVAYNGMARFFPADKIVVTGNPVRHELLECSLSPAEARSSLGLDPDRPTILVIGGSLGARTINHSIGNGLEAIAKSGVQVLWQCGKQGIDYATQALASSDAPLVKATAFVSNMAAAYRAADLVVSRAGASSISELQLLGKPAILVPSPNVAENHQMHNAMALVNEHAAIMIPDDKAPVQLVSEMLHLVNQKLELSSLADSVSRMAKRDATTVIVDKVFEIINNK